MALVIKNPLVKEGDVRYTGSIPELGRSSREGNGNPLQYSCLENPLNRGAWRAIVHGVAKSQTQVKGHSTHAHGQESLRKSGVALRVNKKVQTAGLWCNLINNRMISVSFQANHSTLQLSKSMPQALMLKKLKLTSFMKIYKTF